MKPEFIDLGYGMDNSAMPMTASESPKKSYPCLCFTCDEEIELPDGEFTFMAKGRKVEDSENTRDEKNPRYRYEIEVQGFKPVGGSKEKGMVSMADAFKKGMDKSMMAKMGEDEGEE